MSDEPRLDLAAMAPAVPFLGVGLVLLGARTVVYGVTESVALVGVVGVVAVLVGVGLAWFGFRRGRSTGD